MYKDATCWAHMEWVSLLGCLLSVQGAPWFFLMFFECLDMWVQGLRLELMV